MTRHFIKKDGAWVDVSEEEFKVHSTKPTQKFARQFGLGDAVAAIANPLARALDATIGTHIEGCGGCAQRRKALNKLLPDLSKTVSRKGSEPLHQHSRD